MHTRPAWYVALRALKRVWIWNTVIIVAVTAGLTFLYKLHCLPNNSPLKTLLPAQATIRPAVLHPTRLSSALAKSHPFTLSDGLPIRSRRSVRNAFPACVIPVWNSLPQFLLSRPPQPQHMQQFKTNVHRYLLKSNWNTATDAL